MLQFPVLIYKNVVYTILRLYILDLWSFCGSVYNVICTGCVLAYVILVQQLLTYENMPEHQSSVEGIYLTKIRLCNLSLCIRHVHIQNLLYRTNINVLLQICPISHLGI